MTLPRKKYVLLPLLWIVLFGLAIYCIKMENTANIPRWIANHRLETKQDTAVKHLNMLMPSPEMYKDLMKFNMSPSTTEIPSEDIIEYYQQLTVAMPWMAEGYALLGFCHHRQGLKEKAYEEFQKACMIDPQFFWPCQNLAVMTLEAGQYAAAEQVFALALNADPQHTLQSIMSSKVYRDILAADPSYNPAAGLQEIFATDTKILYLLKNKIAVKPGDINAQIKIF